MSFLARVPKRVILFSIAIWISILFAFFSPFLSPHDPYKTDLSMRLIPPVFQKGGTWNNVLGTDHLGRDMLSRIIYGARVSLLVGFVSTFIGSVIGVILGLLSGYIGGKTDSVINKLMDIQLSFRVILLAIFVISIVGPSFRNVVIVCGIASWVTYARVVRGQVLSIREKEFIEAARGIGCSTIRILTRHVLPNVFSLIIVISTLEIGRIIVLESTLSFLGLGVQPPTPSWGNMILDGKIYMLQAWWITAIPGSVLLMVVLGFNIIGDYLSDLMDPYMKQLME